jgi:hypothetical protein
MAAGKYKNNTLRQWLKSAAAKAMQPNNAKASAPG